MKILFVTPWRLGPTRPRGYGISKLLTENHEVWVLSIVPTGGREGSAPAHLAGETIVRIGRIKSVVNAIRALLRRQSMQVGIFSDGQAHRVFRDVVRKFEPDVIHMNVIRTFGAIPSDVTAPIVYDFDEVRSEYYRQLAVHSRNKIWKLIGRLEASPLHRAEKAATLQSTRVLVSSPSDLSWDAHKTHLVRSPHSLGHEGVRDPDPATMLFTGRMSYQANRQAASWFVEEVLPGVREKIPHAELLIVGESADEFFQASAAAGVRVLGYVETMAPYYQSATLAVVPIEMGTGVQMKLIQALATGVPCVTTPDCARRAGVDGSQVAVASGPVEWTDQIVRLLSEPESCADLSVQGALWAHANYSDEVIGCQLDGVYRGITC